MKQTVTIEEKKDGRLIAGCDKSMCSSCKGSFFCTSKKASFDVLNPKEIPLDKGDRAVIDMPPGKTLLTVFMSFGVPLLMFVPGYLIGRLISPSEGVQLLTSLAGVAVGFALGIAVGNGERGYTVAAGSPMGDDVAEVIAIFHRDAAAVGYAIDMHIAGLHIEREQLYATLGIERRQARELLLGNGPYKALMRRQGYVIAVTDILKHHGQLIPVGALAGGLAGVAEARAGSGRHGYVELHRLRGRRGGRRPLVVARAGRKGKERQGQAQLADC